MKTNYKQKQAACIVFDEDQLCHSRPLLRRLNALNIYQINLSQRLKFMHRLSIDDLPKTFNNTFKKPGDKCPTKYSVCNYSLKNIRLHAVSLLSSTLDQNCGMNFFSNEEKEIESQILFQKRVKSKLLDMENEISYF